MSPIRFNVQDMTESFRATAGEILWELILLLFRYTFTRPCSNFCTKLPLAALLPIKTQQRRPLQVPRILRLWLSSELSFPSFGNTPRAFLPPGATAHVSHCPKNCFIRRPILTTETSCVNAAPLLSSTKCTHQGLAASSRLPFSSSVIQPLPDLPFAVLVSPPSRSAQPMF